MEQPNYIMDEWNLNYFKELMSLRDTAFIYVFNGRLDVSSLPPSLVNRKMYKLAFIVKPKKKV